MAKLVIPNEKIKGHEPQFERLIPKEFTDKVEYEELPSKAELRILGRIFEAEIFSPVKCAQFIRSKLLPSMESRCLIRKQSLRMGGWPPMTVTGWVLTERGRIYWCDSCRKARIPK